MFRVGYCLNRRVFGFCADAEIGGQFPDGRIVENLPQGYLYTQIPLNAAHNLCGFQAVPAEVEEVALDSHALESQHFFPDIGQNGLFVRGRSDVLFV